MQDFKKSLTSRQKEELLDEYSQIQLFTEDFYTKEKWTQENERMAITDDSGQIVLSPKDEELFKEEYVRKFIRFVKKLHNVDHEMNSVRQESLG